MLVYFVVQPDYYGGFNNEGYFVTARIPTSYHSCTFVQQEEGEGRLPGCLVMDDNIDKQCSQGRTGVSLHYAHFIYSNLKVQEILQIKPVGFALEKRNVS